METKKGERERERGRQTGSGQGLVLVPQLTSWDKLGYKRPVVNSLVTLALPRGWCVTVSVPVQAARLSREHALKISVALTRGCHSSPVSSQEALRQMTTSSSSSSSSSCFINCSTEAMSEWDEAKKGDKSSPSARLLCNQHIACCRPERRHGLVLEI